MRQPLFIGGLIMEISKEKLSLKILQTYQYSEVMANNIAQDLLTHAPASLIPSIRAWVDGTPLPEDSSEEYSVSRILRLRGNNDFIEAFRLYIAYSQDPEMGKSMICHPARLLRV